MTAETSQAMEGESAEAGARAVGADAFQTRPCFSEGLEAEIRRHLGRTP